MKFRTPLAHVRGLGSAKEGVAHWWAQRVTAVAMVPLILWFVISIIGQVGADHAAMHAWLGNPGNAAGMILLIGAVFHHAQLGLQVVLEDYVHNDAVRTVAVLAAKFAALLLATHAAVSVLMVAVGV